MLYHPCVPSAAGPADSCDNPANYAGFERGNADWSYRNGKWTGTMPYDPAIWGCDGIRVRFVFADKKTGAHAKGSINVVNSRN